MVGRSRLRRPIWLPLCATSSLVAALLHQLLPLAVRARTFSGTIATSASWVHLAHFAFKAERETVILSMDDGSGTATGSTFDEQMGWAARKVPDRGILSLTVRNAIFALFYLFFVGDADANADEDAFTHHPYS